MVQVVNLHYMLSKMVVKARPTVLWCYKKELYLSSHRKKRMRQIKKMAQRGLLDPEKEDPFSLFVASTNIRYCYYADTHKILGNTYGMLVLQDFEALTPNLLARTIETVEGGGIVVMLLSKLDSLTRLYSLVMDVHARMRTEGHGAVVPRFNERLVLSLAGCQSCILVDDELNILPTSTHVKHIQPVKSDEDAQDREKNKGELGELVESLSDVQPAGALVSRCRTLDQARAVISFLDAASEKTLRSTVALTAARGRGKSAALGLAIAGALGLGYSNIFVTAPSPENLRTLFEFIFKGLDELGFKEHLDYDLVESSNPAFGKAVVRVNVYRTHRQTVQYFQPQHHAKMSQAELLVIDEAAAIPLPMVKAMLGPYLVFLCSTVNGYEGTGRSLSLKLIQQLRAQGAKTGSSAGARKQDTGLDGVSGVTASARTFREIILNEPIRYAYGDPVESWLNDLLCLNAAEYVPPVPARLPHPDECEVYYVERDTLFSGHRASEAFLQRVMSLFVASHYRNTPNDLLLLADAPAHHVFALLGPIKEDGTALPDVLAVAQVAMEGAISKRNAQVSLAQGQLPQGDLIPWTVGQQFQDSEFPGLSGARIVRISVHPDIPRAGYGTRMLEVLRRYFEGDISDVLDDVEGKLDNNFTENKHKNEPNGKASPGNGNLLTEQLRPRSGLPPLLTSLADRRPERLHYLGASFGLTQELFSFWRKNAYLPVYLRQTPSEVTGEHTVIVLRPLKSFDVENSSWLEPFVSDFRTRFMSLLGGAFRNFHPALALSILDPKLRYSDEDSLSHKAQNVGRNGTTKSGESDYNGSLVCHGDGSPFTPYDMKRLQAYASNLVDHHLVLDLVPSLSNSYFSGSIPCTLSYAQAAILVCLGLQQSNIETLETVLDLPAGQILALFAKSIRRLHAHLKSVKEAEVARTLPKPTSIGFAPQVEEELDEELGVAAAAVEESMKVVLKPEEMEEFAIKSGSDAFESAVGYKTPKSGGVVAVGRETSTKTKKISAITSGQKDETKKKSKDRGHSETKHSKKRKVSK